MWLFAHQQDQAKPSLALTSFDSICWQQYTGINAQKFWIKNINFVFDFINIIECGNIVFFCMIGLFHCAHKCIGCAAEEIVPKTHWTFCESWLFMIVRINKWNTIVFRYVAQAARICHWLIQLNRWWSRQTLWSLRPSCWC